METINEYTFIYGRINAIEYLLQTLVIAQLPRGSAAQEIAGTYKEAAQKEVATMKITGGKHELTEAVHEEMKAAIDRWFDALLLRLEMNSPSPLQQSDPGKKH